jgi:hypothetical protein
MIGAGLIIMTIDPRLQMFISTYCAGCMLHSCEGALNEQHRSVCTKHRQWLNLSEPEQSKLFMKAMTKEIINLENIIEE